MNILRGINVMKNVRHINFRPTLVAMPLSTHRFYDTNSSNQRHNVNVPLVKLPAFENVSMSRRIDSSSIKRYVSSKMVPAQKITFSSRLRHQIDPYMKLVRMDRPIGR